MRYFFLTVFLIALVILLVSRKKQKKHEAELAALLAEQEKNKPTIFDNLLANAPALPGHAKLDAATDGNELVNKYIERFGKDKVEEKKDKDHVESVSDFKDKYERDSKTSRKSPEEQPKPLDVRSAMIGQVVLDPKSRKSS